MTTTWLRHWGLARDPFAAPDPRRSAPAGFVPLPGHVAAVLRLAEAIESADRAVRLEAPAGLGKTAVLAETLERTWAPTRKVARVADPGSGVELMAGLAARLGMKVDPGLGRAHAWRALADAARLVRFQGGHLVLVVDGCHALTDPADRRDLDRLDQVDPDPAARVTVIRSTRIDPEAEPDPDPAPSWDLTVRLARLTRAEAGFYLDTRLAQAGRPGPTFTSRAVARLHARAGGGVLIGVERLARLALRAAAARGLEIVPPEVVDAVAADQHDPHPSAVALA